MIQGAVETVKQIAPNTYVIILLALFIAKEVIAMTFKGISVLRGSVNGKGVGKKDETKQYACLQSPLFTGPWETHKQEAHDTKVIADRLDSGMGKLLLESTKQTLEAKTQTTEIRKQTRILEKIQENGHTI